MSVFEKMLASCFCGVLCGMWIGFELATWLVRKKLGELRRRAG